jgi:hypothetical protein
MHNLFLVYFVNLYMFRACLGPSSGGTSVRIQQLVLIILCIWLSVVLLDNRTTDSHLQRIIIIGWTTDSNLQVIISTNCCIHTVVRSDNGPRCDRNMLMLTKYAKNRLCIKLVSLYTIISRSHDQQNIKKYPLHVSNNPIFIIRSLLPYMQHTAFYNDKIVLNLRELSIYTVSLKV